jgi:hypothetical protein
MNDFPRCCKLLVQKIHESFIVLVSMSFWEDKPSLITVITHNCLKFMLVEVGSKGFDDTAEFNHFFPRKLIGL